MAELDRGIREVLAETFGLDPADVDTGASRETIAGWDSLGQIGLVLALEKRFDVAIDVQDIAGLTSYAAVRDVVAALTKPAT